MRVGGVRAGVGRVEAPSKVNCACVGSRREGRGSDGGRE